MSYGNNLRRSITYRFNIKHVLPEMTATITIYIDLFNRIGRGTVSPLFTAQSH